MSELFRARTRRLLRATTATAVSGLLLVSLLVAELWFEPERFSLADLGITIGLFAPLALAAIASTPAILAGGFDLSIGPLMGVLNALLVQGLIISWGVDSPWLIISAALVLGALFGAFNGILHAVVRLPAMVATLSTFIVYGGLAILIAPAPGGQIPEWLASLATTTSLVPILGAFLIWWLVRRTSLYTQLMATGGDDRAAYANGIPVTAVRVIAYTIGGLFAGIAALSLTALLGSVDATVGPTYTMGAIAAVAIGGASLAGGYGGLVGSLIGAGVIFLTQGLLTYFLSSPFTLPISYGLVLVLAVCINAVIRKRLAVWGDGA